MGRSCLFRKHSNSATITYRFSTFLLTFWSLHLPISQALRTELVSPTQPPWCEPMQVWMQAVSQTGMHECAHILQLQARSSSSLISEPSLLFGVQIIEGRGYQRVSERSVRRSTGPDATFNCDVSQAGKIGEKRIYIHACFDSTTPNLHVAWLTIVHTCSSRYALDKSRAPLDPTISSH